MGQFYARKTTYVAGVTQVRSEDLNDLQDQAVHLIGAAGRNIPLFPFYAKSGSPAWFPSAAPRLEMANGDRVLVSIPTLAGEKIGRWELTYRSSMTSPAIGGYFSTRVLATQTSLGSFDETDLVHDSTWRTLSMDESPIGTIAANSITAFDLSISAGGGALWLEALTVYPENA